MWPHEFRGAAVEKAFVNLVNLRCDMRIVRFWRSTNDVDTCSIAGSPQMGARTAPMHAAGL